MTAKATKDITANSFRAGQHYFRTDTGHGTERSPGLRYSNHPNIDQLTEDVLEMISYGISHNLIGHPEITREALSLHFEVPEHQIEQAFQKLKIRGFLGTAENRPPHDSKRDTHSMPGHENSWIGSVWPIHIANVVEEKLNTYEGFSVSLERQNKAGEKYVAYRGETTLQAGNYKLLKDLVDHHNLIRVRKPAV